MISGSSLVLWNENNPKSDSSFTGSTDFAANLISLIKSIKKLESQICSLIIQNLWKTTTFWLEDKKSKVVAPAHLRGEDSIANGRQLKNGNKGREEKRKRRRERGRANEEDAKWRRGELGDEKVKNSWVVGTGKYKVGRT